ncbi:MAG: hypothetical protein KKB50_21655 [Planctomycetes bacterium]|nr:hypothetical protein [Planctomycetota bacterium]
MSSSRHQRLINRKRRIQYRLRERAWSLKAWFALLLPERGRWKEKYRHPPQATAKSD